ncbi:MAG: 1,4-dihydroxy-2-naphthoate octaprenyltransferase [Bacteroidia bacterium]|nr:1,4-dihydroxy-2-naphthoate octaprenyltransferase [Bacteroidia bacterium]
MVIKTWINALRLRTLPLAISAIAMGIALADMQYSANIRIGVLCMLTAILLQIVSNLANDYGDFVKGTDNENRIGNTRALQSGTIQPKQMKVAIILFVVLSLASGISMLLIATNGKIDAQFMLFFLLGLVAIAAAIKYTVGKNAYGYSGLGDVAVFLFFGPVSVLGTFFLSSGFDFNWQTDAYILLPTFAIGLLSAAVLNTNNIRDIENDKASGKNTIPVKIGVSNARIYHTFLIATAILCVCGFLAINYLHWLQLLQLPALYFIIKTWVKVLKKPPSAAYNHFLKQLSIGTLLFVFVFIITNWLARIYTMTIVIKDLL